MEDLKQHLVNKWRASKDRYYKVLATRTVFLHLFSAKVKCKPCIPNNPIYYWVTGIVYCALLLSCLGTKIKRDNNRKPNFSAEFRIHFIT